VLYDLTSTYFEVNASDCRKAASAATAIADKRPDCPQVVIALVVTPEACRWLYEVLPAHRDSKTLRMSFPRSSGNTQGAAVWVMDRGVRPRPCWPRCATASAGAVLVGTPKGRLNRLEKHLLEKPGRTRGRREGQASGRGRRALRLRASDESGQ